MLRQITDVLGTLQYTASYYPYGNPFQTIGSLTAAVGFTREFTAPNGSPYLRARCLQPGYGTFLSKDPFEGVLQRVMVCPPIPMHQGRVEHWRPISIRVSRVNSNAKQIG